MFQYTFEQREKIDKYYRDHGLDLENFTVEEFRKFFVYDLDSIDGVDTFHCTPIERNIFDQIRNSSLVFLPEYKIGKYYCDFVNPELKIIIEADGKHHENQSDYDEERDAFLASKGFSVYRFKGAQTFKCYEDFLDDRELFIEELRDEYEQTSEYFIQRLSKENAA